MPADFLFLLLFTFVLVYMMICLYYSIEIGFDFVPILSKNPSNPMWITA